MLYFFDKFELITEDCLEELILAMPQGRQIKARKYKMLEDRKACAMAYHLLCQGLKQEYDIENPEIIYNEFGKPYLKNNKEVFFNISHTKKIVVCVLANKEVGIDVEEVRTYDKKIIDKILNEEEKQKIKDDKDFIKYWTIKEAVCKCEGTGIANFDFKNIKYDNYDFDMRYYEDNNSYMTICYKK